MTLGRDWIGAAHFGAGFFGCEHPFDAYASGEDHRPAGLGARSGRCCCGVLCLPMPREKLANPLGWMIAQPSEDVRKPGARINIVELGGLYQGVDGSGTPPAFI